MAQWKISPAEERRTTQLFIYTKDGMTITGRHYIDSIELVVESDTKPNCPEEGVEGGFDLTSLTSDTSLTLVDVQLIKPYDYKITLDIDSEEEYKIWRSFLSDENNAFELSRIHLLENQGWTLNEKFVIEGPITVTQL